jgi:hypothetical protein
MPFEKFTKVGKTFRPRISIRSGGQMGFNQGSRNRFELDKYGYVVLYFDRENSRIGIKLTNDNNEEGAITLHKRKVDVAISVKSFLYHYDINFDKTIIFDPIWDEENKMIVLDLKKQEENEKLI